MVFEYDALLLEQQTGKLEGTYRWRATRQGYTCGLREIDKLLNRLGGEGWRVAAYSSDDRFGSLIILERQVSGDTNGAAPLKLGSAGKAILGEVRALRDRLDDVEFWHRPMDAAIQRQRKTFQEIAEEARASTREALPAILAELQKLPEHLRPPVPSPLPERVTVTLDNESVERLTRAFQDAAPTIEVEPVFIPAPHVAVSPTPIHVAPAVTLDAGSVEALAAAVSSSPPAQVTLDQAVIDQLVAAIYRGVPTVEAQEAYGHLYGVMERVARAMERFNERPLGPASIALDSVTITSLARALRKEIVELPTPQITLPPVEVASMVNVDEAVFDRIAGAIEGITIAPPEVVVRSPSLAPLEKLLNHHLSSQNSVIENFLERIAALLARRQEPVQVPPIDITPVVRALEPLRAEMRANRPLESTELGLRTIIKLSEAIAGLLAAELKPAAPPEIIPEPEPEPLPVQTVPEEEVTEPEPVPTPWWQRLWKW